MKCDANLKGSRSLGTHVDGILEQLCSNNRSNQEPALCHGYGPLCCSSNLGEARTDKRLMM